MRHCLGIFMYCIPLLTAGQGDLWLRGSVSSQGHPVPFAHIQLSGMDGGAVADGNGNFQLQVKAPAVTLLITAVGYADQTVNVDVQASRNVHIEMTEAIETLGEVVVTGMSRATAARENPMPVVVVSEQMLQQRGGTNLIETLARQVPGLSTVSTGPNVSKPFIRGLGYNRVLTLYDGIRQEGQQWGDEHGIEADGYLLEKAEVIKGPASLAFGSDALAGVVSLLPATPENAEPGVHGRWLSEFQHNNGLIGNSLKLTTRKGQWSALMSGSSRIARNYRNALDGFVYNTGFREYHGATTLTRQTTHARTRLALTLYDNHQGIPDGSRDSLTRKFTRQVLEAGLDDPRHRPIADDDALRSYTLSPLHQHISHYRAYAQHRQTLGRSDVQATLGYSMNRRREFNHPTLPAQAGMDMALHTVNYAVRYNLPEVRQFETSIGVNGMWQFNRLLDATNFPIPTYDLQEHGVYLTEQYHHHRLVVSGGIRFDHRRITVPDLHAAIDPVTGFERIVDAGAPGNHNLFPSFAQTFRGLTTAAGITWRWSDAVSLKANVARGYRAPSMAEIASNGLDPGAHIVYIGNRNFLPEFNWQSDVGFTITNRFWNVSGAVFHNSLHNFIHLTQVTDANGQPLRDSQGNRTFQYQQASAQLYGGELAWEYNHSTGLRWSSSAALCYGFNRREAFRGKGIMGEYLPLIPPLTVRSTVEKQFAVKGRSLQHWSLTATAEVFGSQSRYMELYQTETPTPGYTLVSAGAGAEYKLFGQRLQFQLQVNNLFDRVYQSNMSRLKYFEYYQRPAGSHSGISGMGRNIAVKITLAF